MDLAVQTESGLGSRRPVQNQDRLLVLAEQAQGHEFAVIENRTVRERQLIRHGGNAERPKGHVQQLPVGEHQLDPLARRLAVVGHDHPVAQRALEVEVVRRVVQVAANVVRDGRGEVSAHAGGQQIDQAEQVVLLRQPPAFCQGRVVVVTGGLPSIRTGDQPRAPEPEVRPAVEHVVVDLRAAAEQFHRPAEAEPGVARLVFPAPVVETPVPEFRDDQRRVVLAVAQPLGIGNDPIPAVDALDRPFDLRFGKAVAGDHRDVEAAATEHLRDEVQVRLPVRLGGEKVLVLVLDEDDVPALGDLVLGQAGQNLGKILVDVVRESGVVHAVTDAALGVQPARQAAEIPFGADVRSGPENHIQPEVVGEVDELHDVLVALEIPLPFGRFVEVPGHVGADAVQTGPLGLEKPIRPQRRRRAEIMHRTAGQPDPLPIDHDTATVISHIAHGGAPCWLILHS